MGDEDLRPGFNLCRWIVYGLRIVGIKDPWGNGSRGQWQTVLSGGEQGLGVLVSTDV